MQSNNPVNDASSSSHAYTRSWSSTPTDDDGRNGRAGSGHDGATRQPRLHAGNRSEKPLISDDRCLDDGTQEIHALNDQLRSLRAADPLRLADAVHFFRTVKASEQTLKAFLRDEPYNPALRRLAGELLVIVPRLRMLLCGDSSASLDIDAIHTLCLGLSTCVAPAIGAMFDKKRQQELKSDLQAITDLLMERACKAGLPTAIASIGTVLDILNWASRALKADCIDVSPSIKAIFDAALAVFGELLAVRKSLYGLTPHQIGKCAVQINAVLRFRLIRLDGSEQGLAGRRRLATVAQHLCSAELAARLGAGKIDAVAYTNVCNLVKDMMERGLLPAATNGPILEGLTGLVGLILRIPADQMLADDCRTLSNCTNFLRQVGGHDTGMPEQPLVPNWVAASHVLLGVVNEKAFMNCLPSGQAVANLISFVKRCDRHLRHSMPAVCNTTTTTPAGSLATTTTTLASTVWPSAAATDSTTASAGPGLTQDMLRSAASQLIRHALGCGPDAFTAPETLSGLLSGVDYIARRNLAPATPELRTFLAALIDNMAWCSMNWKAKSRMVALPALRGLLAAKLVTLEQAQPGLAALLGPCGNASGYSMADLAAAIRDQGVIEDEIPALPPAEALSPVLAPPSSKKLRPLLPPGQTRIIPPSTASSGHSNIGKQTAPSFRAAASPKATTLVATNKPESQQWQTPHKVARINPRAEVSISSTPPSQAQKPVPSMTATPPRQDKVPQPTLAKQVKPVRKKNPQTKRAPNASAEPAVPQPLKQPASQARMAQNGHSALASALASGQLTVVKTLMVSKAGYPNGKMIGPFLSGVEDDIVLLDGNIIASLDYFLAMQDDAARAEIRHYFATRQPASVGMKNLLTRHRLIDTGVETTIPTLRTPPAGMSTTVTTTTTTTATASITARDFKTSEQEDAWAQFNLGDSYWNGIGVNMDKGKAFGCYSAAAYQGLVQAQCNVGYCYWNGIGVKEDKAQAVGWYRTAARNGDANAQYTLGMCYEFGINVNMDMTTAVKWFSKAAHQGLAQAQFALASCYDMGIGIKEDNFQAFEWYKKAGNQGFAIAQLYLGHGYWLGIGTTKDHAEAFAWYSKAANQGLVAAQSNLGNCYWDGLGVAQDYKKAAECYEKAANHGCAGSQTDLGTCYWNGLGVIKDPVKAIEWYEKAAAQGFAAAQFNLGSCYWHAGTGIPQDHAKAFAWYEKAANQGYSHAQLSLAECYWKGMGVKEDKVQALAWYEKAANQEIAEAQLNLSNFYLNGIVVPRDYAKAFSWSEKAAIQGLAQAQFFLGNFYLDGIGVRKDIDQAKQWFRKAADQGCKEAEKFLN